MDPNSLKYTTTHEWVSVDGTTAVVGITDFAVKTLTDLIFLELPQVGADTTAGEPFGEVESVKAVSELAAPVSGKIVEVNSAVADDLAVLGGDPLGDGWLVKIEMSDPSEVNSLMDRASYEKQCDE